jgi:hypothetical protein
MTASRRFRFVPFSLVVLAVLTGGGFSIATVVSDQDAESRPASSAKAADLSFLTGGWRLKRGGAETEEHWLAPKGGTLMGLSRTTAGERTIEFEFLRIVETKTGLDYVAQPNGGKPTRFKLTSLGASEAVFENPEHDFPTKIAYAKSQDGGLTAVVSGPGRDGAEKKLVFAFEPIR